MRERIRNELIQHMIEHSKKNSKDYLTKLFETYQQEKGKIYTLPESKITCYSTSFIVL